MIRMRFCATPVTARSLLTSRMLLTPAALFLQSRGRWLRQRVASLKRFDVLQADEVTYRRDTVVGYGYGGVVQDKFDGEADDAVATWLDLTKQQYRWDA